MKPVDAHIRLLGNQLVLELTCLMICILLYLTNLEKEFAQAAILAISHLTDTFKNLSELRTRYPEVMEYMNALSRKANMIDLYFSFIFFPLLGLLLLIAGLSSAISAKGLLAILIALMLILTPLIKATNRRITLTTAR